MTVGISTPTKIAEKALNLGFQISLLLSDLFLIKYIVVTIVGDNIVTSKNNFASSLLMPLVPKMANS